jgi:hypothetical protein
VWLGLGGDAPKHGRAPAFYRGGDNPQAVSLDDRRGLWYDHRERVGGGVLKLIQHVRGCDRQKALHWLADLIGVEVIDRETTHAERTALADRRERELRKMQEAELFRRAAECIAEHVLEELPEAVPERYAPTQLLLSLRAAHGAALLALYRVYQEREPRLTAALVYAAERAWHRLCCRLARFINSDAKAPHAT